MAEIRKGGVPYHGPIEVVGGVDITQDADGVTQLVFSPSGAGLTVPDGRWSFTIKVDTTVQIDVVGNQYANGFSYVHSTTSFPTSASGHKVVALTSNKGNFQLQNMGDTNPRLIAANEVIYMTGWFWSDAACTTDQSNPIQFRITKQEINAPSINVSKTLNASNQATVSLTIVDTDNRLRVTNPVMFSHSSDGGTTFTSETPGTFSGGSYNYTFTMSNLNVRYQIRYRVYYTDKFGAEIAITDIVDADPSTVPASGIVFVYGGKYQPVVSGSGNAKLGSVKIKTSLVGYPTLNDVRTTGTAVDVDPTLGSWYWEDLSTVIPADSNAYVTVLPYSGAGGTGIEGWQLTATLNRPPQQKPTGTVEYFVDPETGDVDLRMRGNVSAASIKYKISTSGYDISETNANVVTDIARVAFHSSGPYGYCSGKVLGATTLAGPEVVEFVTVWFYETEDYQLPGDVVKLLIQGVEKPDAFEDDPSSIIYNGAAFNDSDGWELTGVPNNMSVDLVTKRQGIGAFKLDHTGTINSLRVNGTAASTLVADAPTDGTGIFYPGREMTIEARLYLPSLPSGGIRLIEVGEVAAAVPNYIRLSASGEILTHFQVDWDNGLGAEAANTDYASQVNFPIGGYHTLTVTYNGGTCGLWIDGVLLSSYRGSLHGGSFQWASGFPASISIGPEAKELYVDEVRIWDVALTPAMIRQNHNVKYPSTHPNLRGHWKFQEGTGSTIADSSGKGQPITRNTTHTTWVQNRIGDEEWYQDFTVASGDVIEAAGYIKTDSLAGAGEGAFLNVSQVSGTAPTLIDVQSTSTGFSDTGYNAGIARALGTVDWTQQRIVFQATGTSVFRIAMRLGGAGNVTGTAWFDDITVKKVDPNLYGLAITGAQNAGTDPANLLLNGGAQKDLASWTNGAGTLLIDNNVLVIARFGDKAFYFDHTAGASYSYAYQDIVVTAGQVIQVSGWVEHNSGGSLAPSYAGFQLSGLSGCTVTVTDKNGAPYTAAADANGFCNFGIQTGTTFKYVYQVMKVVTGGTIRVAMAAGSPTNSLGYRTHFDGVSAVVFPQGVADDATVGRIYAGTNPVTLVTNGLSQSDPIGSNASGWTLSSGNAMVVQNTYFKYGDRCSSVTAHASQSSRSYQDIAIEQGQIYEVSGWIKNVSAPLSVLDIDTTGATIQVLELKAPYTDVTNNYIGIPAGSTDFAFVYATFRAITAGTLRLFTHVASGSGAAYFDGIRAIKKDTYATTIAETANQGTNLTFDQADVSKWLKRGGAGSSAVTLTTGGVSGNNIMQITGEGFWEYNQKLPFDPSKLYKLRFRVRQLTDPSAPGGWGKQAFLGVQVYDAAGAAVAIPGGSAAFYVAANAVGIGAGTTWTEYTGWFKGNGGTTHSVSQNPLTPIALPGATAYITPYVIANYATSTNGVFEIDSITIEVMDEVATPDAINARVAIGGAYNELLTNGGGQSSAVNSGQAFGWTHSSGAVLTVANDYTKFGDRCLKLDHAAVATNSWSYQQVPIVAGQMYEASAWIKTDSVGTGTNIGAFLNIDADVSLTSLLGEAPVKVLASATVATDVGVNGTTDWTFVRSVFKANATGTLTIYLHLGYAGTTVGTAWFDGVSVVNITTNAAVQGNHVIVDSLSAINANLGHVTAGKVEGPSGTVGINFNGEKPAAWTSFIDFMATGIAAFLQHSSLKLFADGRAEFTGQLNKAQITDELTAYIREAIEWRASDTQKKARITGDVTADGPDSIQFEHGTDPVGARPFAYFDSTGAKLGDGQYQATVVYRGKERPTNPTEGMLWVYGGACQSYENGVWWPQWGIAALPNVSSTQGEAQASQGIGTLAPVTNVSVTLMNTNYFTLSYTASTSTVDGVYLMYEGENGPNGLLIKNMGTTGSFSGVLTRFRADCTYRARLVPYRIVHNNTNSGTMYLFGEPYFFTFTTNAISGITVPVITSITVNSSTSLTVNWTDSSTTNNGYRVWYSVDGGVNYTSLATVSNAATRSYQHNGLSAGQTVWYKVSTYQSTGVTGQGGFLDSKDSNAMAGQTSQSSAPTAPTLTNVSGISSSAIALNWLDNSSDEQGFKVYRSTTSGGSYSLIATLSANVTSYTNTSGLLPSTTYWYKVSAYNTAGESALSSPLSGTTSASSGGGGGSAPNDPTNFRSTASTSSSISLAWDHSGGCDGFRIYRNGTLVQTAASGDRSWTNNSGLSASTSYSYTIIAYNSNGDSGSAGCNASTSAATLSAPTFGSATDASVCDYVKDLPLYYFNVSWTNGDATAETEVYRDGTLVWTAAAGSTSANGLSGSSSGLKAITVRHVKAGYTPSSTSGGNVTLSDPCSA